MMDGTPGERAPVAASPRRTTTAAATIRASGLLTTLDRRARGGSAARLIPTRPESSGPDLRGERDSSGLDAVGLQRVALSLRTLDQRVEVDVTQSPAHACEIAQVRPKHPLAVKSKR